MHEGERGHCALLHSIVQRPALGRIEFNQIEVDEMARWGYLGKEVLEKVENFA